MKRIVTLCSAGIIFLALRIFLGGGIFSLILAIAAAAGFITLANNLGWLKTEDAPVLFQRDEDK